jgi:hypothetical protein
LPAAVNNKFIKAQVSLPGPSYFGAGGYAQGCLVILSGRTNTQPTYASLRPSPTMRRFAAHAAAPPSPFFFLTGSPCVCVCVCACVVLIYIRPWTYFSDLYVVNFTTSISA